MKQRFTSIVLVAFGLAGCAPIMSRTDWSDSSPANPAAPQASYPAARGLLMAETNLAMIPQTAEQHVPQPPGALTQTNKLDQHEEHNHHPPSK